MGYDTDECLACYLSLGCNNLVDSSYMDTPVCLECLQKWEYNIKHDETQQFQIDDGACSDDEEDTPVFPRESRLSLPRVQHAFNEKTRYANCIYCRKETYVKNVTLCESHHLPKYEYFSFTTNTPCDKSPIAVLVHVNTSDKLEDYSTLYQKAVSVCEDDGIIYMDTAIGEIQYYETVCTEDIENFDKLITASELAKVSLY